MTPTGNSNLDFFEEAFVKLEQNGFKRTGDYDFISFYNKDTKYYLSFRINSNGSFKASCWLPGSYAPNPQVLVGKRVAKETLNNIVNEVLAGYGFVPESVLPEKKNESKKSRKPLKENTLEKLADKIQFKIEGQIENLKELLHRSGADEYVIDMWSADIERLKKDLKSLEKAYLDGDFEFICKLSDKYLKIKESSENCYTAYHIGPNLFADFDLEHIGDGFSTQLKGWGLYFTLDKDVIEYYRAQLEDCEGPDYEWYLYEVEIEKDHIESEYDECGWELYAQLVDELGSEKEASKSMVEDNGIDGIKYYDEEDGNSLLIFNPKIIHIKKTKPITAYGKVFEEKRK